MKAPDPRSKTTEGAAQEAAVLARLRRGEPEAQHWLVEAHRERIYRTAVHFLGWRDPDAEDLVQETFALAFKSLGGFEGRSTLYTWLNQICARLCFKRLRQRQRLALGAEADLRESLQMPARGDDALQALLGQEQKSLLRAGLLAMEKPCREVLERRDLQGQAYGPAAAALKLPIGTFMSRLARCRERLRAWILERQR
jgi:RNA polymerase sigma-70 factor (ECF subfamily)